ncbi:MAG: hypothetical protein WC521_06445 [Bdellovibrionales bacterium]
MRAKENSVPLRKPENLPYLRPTNPISMGGYEEDHDDLPAGGSDILMEQSRYLEEKAELEAAIMAPKNRWIKEYADMLKQVRRVSDELLQAKLINAWFNVKMHFDDDEARIFNEDGPIRSLHDALIYSKGIPSQTAKLKLFSLEKVGFKHNDIRYVAEYYYKGGDREDHFIGESDKDGSNPFRCNGMHAIAVAHIGENTWALDNKNEKPINWGIDDEVRCHLSQTEAWNYVLDAAEIESAATHLNISQNSFIRHNPCCFRWKALYRPFAEFNSTQAAEYKGIDHPLHAPFFPAQALNAPETSVTLTHAEIKKIDVCALMASAFSAHHTYKSGSDAAYLDAPPRPPRAWPGKPRKGDKTVSLPLSQSWARLVS